MKSDALFELLIIFSVLAGLLAISTAFTS